MELKNYIKNRSEIASRKIQDNLIIITTKSGLRLVAFLNDFNFKNLSATCDVL